MDDDIRNIFALTSCWKVIICISCQRKTGRDAIQILQDTPDVDVVLMDIMMPEFEDWIRPGPSAKFLTSRSCRSSR